MASIGYRNDGIDERRIGQRAPAEPLAITWVVPRTGVFSLRRNHREVPGAVGDVSLTGAGVLGPSELPFEIGDTVLIRHEGYDSSVIVRRREAAAEPGTEVFGVEFVVVHPMLRREIRRRLDAASAKAP